MKRHAHALKDNHKSEIPYEFLFFDTETLPRRIDDDTEEHVFRLGVACHWSRSRQKRRERDRWKDLHSADELWLFIDDVCKPRTRLLIFAHNIGFDLQVIGGPKALAEHGWKVEKAIIDDPPFILQARRGTSTILLLDWYNYFRGSLAFCGELLGVPKHPMPDFGASDSDWFSYCRNDVLVLYTAVKKWTEFIKDYDLGTFAQTLAGQSLNAYRHRFMGQKIYIHDRKSAIALERDSYTGGRVEMFQRNTLPSQTYTYVDINSAYPAVMRDGEFPTSLVKVIDNPSVKKLEELCRNHLVVASVSVQTNTPLLPLRMDGRLVFPIGGFNTTLATPEIKLALSRNLVKSVGLCAVYKKGNIFREWVTEIYRLRAEAKASGDIMYDEMLKRLMNSLFGKFGQRNFDWKSIAEEIGEEDRIWREHNVDSGLITTFRRVGGIKQVRLESEEGFNSFVAIASHVTSAARCLLLTYIESAGWEHVYYCDTDSLIVDEAGIRPLMPALHPNELGKLKIEGTASKVELLAPKNYRFGNLIKHKGRRANAKDLQDGRYEQEQFVSLVGAMRRGWNGGPLVRTIRKRDALAYHKGTIDLDGRISPLLLLQPRLERIAPESVPPLAPRRRQF